MQNTQQVESNADFAQVLCYAMHEMEKQPNINVGLELNCRLSPDEAHLDPIWVRWCPTRTHVIH